MIIGQIRTILRIFNSPALSCPSKHWDFKVMPYRHLSDLKSHHLVLKCSWDILPFSVHRSGPNVPCSTFVPEGGQASVLLMVAVYVNGPVMWGRCIMGRWVVTPCSTCNMHDKATSANFSPICLHTRTDVPGRTHGSCPTNMCTCLHVQVCLAAPMAPILQTCALTSSCRSAWSHPCVPGHSSTPAT